MVASTALAGVLLLDQWHQQGPVLEWVAPLVLVGVVSFLVAHCFLSLLEMVVDVLFLCFAVDTKYNDGSPGREFFMDKALMVRRGTVNGGGGGKRVKSVWSTADRDLNCTLDFTIDCTGVDAAMHRVVTASTRTTRAEVLNINNNNNNVYMEISMQKLVHWYTQMPKQCQDKKIFI